ncbi:putative transcriptional regulator, TetR family protein [Virgisporangium aliadipatigenens]|uniref:Putative transcriptional regulator, TetR family protein n=1 Tax=Virgisporangium aliadipatigenens TaxID=741659 RepID=A0A8J3YLM4_9ACTN|nr:WHG domain-containing protein [Virgisporangium aliadipatigenens]GIJ46028.1 putative transcriptional regulator, TetR family protein [Virgisporangium aliadipatigenens]
MSLYDKLLAAALDLATAPRPVTIPSLRSVARACDVSATAVYRHFPSQSALNKALLMGIDNSFAAAVSGADAPHLLPRERLHRIGRAYLDWGIRNPGLYQLRFESADALGDDYVRGDVADRVIEGMDALLKAAGREAVRGQDLWIAAHGLVSLRIHKPFLPWTDDLDAEVERLLTLWGIE